MKAKMSEYTNNRKAQAERTFGRYKDKEGSKIKEIARNAIDKANLVFEKLNTMTIEEINALSKTVYDNTDKLYDLLAKYEKKEQPTEKDKGVTLTEQLKNIIYNNSKLRVKRWTKGNQDRLYVDNFHPSKNFYIDLNNMTAKGNRGGAYSDIENILALANIENIEII